MERSADDALEAAKLAALAEFAAGAGHEINNPLAVIAGRAQLLLRDETDPERRRDLALINAQAMRVTEMIADLRLFAACPRLEREPLDLPALVRDALAEKLAEKGTSLIFAPPPAPVASGASSSISGDRVQLIVAVRALCQNALEAAGQGGRVEVSLSFTAGEARIRVADDGPGITPQQREHIFEPFYSARQAGRGVGMGLSKCWRIVNEHGGHIEVESPATGGAVFTICLPAGSAGSIVA